MSDHSAAWMAGYEAGRQSYAPASIVAITVPDAHRDSAADFMSGFFCGSRDGADQELIESIIGEGGSPHG